MRRWAKFILKVLALTIIVLIVAGVVYEQLGERRDKKLFSPQIGRSVDIGGRTLNIHCAGEGSPTVILEAPGNGPGYVWAPIQAEIAKFTQVCWYDRAGEGWSDPGPFPQTSAAIAKDLHELLPRAGVPTPCVLVGFSSGGLNVRVYNGLYPNEVAGMVLVDSAHEDEPKRAPKFYLGHNPPRYLWYPLHLKFQTTRHIGLLRLIQPSPPRVQDG
jgi:pimeloyl-ACP methyl ester carboxylesterase